MHFILYLQEIGAGGGKKEKIFKEIIQYRHELTSDPESPVCVKFCFAEVKM